MFVVSESGRAREWKKKTRKMVYESLGGNAARARSKFNVAWRSIADSVASAVSAGAAREREEEESPARVEDGTWAVAVNVP